MFPKLFIDILPLVSNGPFDIFLNECEKKWSISHMTKSLEKLTFWRTFNFSPESAATYQKGF